MRDLTGNYYHKQTWCGMVLMVEHYITVCDFAGDDSPPVKVWNKAKDEDLVYIEFKK